MLHTYAARFDVIENLEKFKQGPNHHMNSIVAQLSTVPSTMMLTVPAWKTMDSSGLGSSVGLQQP
jgi:hypothetical protein